MARSRGLTNPSPSQLKNEPQGEGERSHVPTVYTGKLCLDLAANYMSFALAFTCSVYVVIAPRLSALPGIACCYIYSEVAS